MVSRVLRAISKANCGWLRPCTLGGFLLFGQKKATKEKAARSRRLPLALLAGIGARLTRRALNNAPRARSKVLRKLRFRLRCSAASTGLKTSRRLSARPDGVGKIFHFLSFFQKF